MSAPFDRGPGGLGIDGDQPLRTARLAVRPVRAEDTDALWQIRVLVEHFQTPIDISYDEQWARNADMETRIPGAAPGWHQYVIIRASDDLIIGDVGINFHHPTPSQAELGYSIHPDHHGHGYGREAVARLLEHLFVDHAMHRCTAITGADNHRSQRLLEAVGFRREGLWVASWWQRDEGRWTDELTYALLASEWSARR